MSMNRVALVTGSAQGLGVQIVKKLANEGMRVMINYRSSRAEAEKLQESIQKQGLHCATVQGDISKKEDCQHIVRHTFQKWGRVDILVHNAGPYIFERKKTSEYTDEEWDWILSGNLSSAFFLAREVIPHMRRQSWGRIITLGFDQAAQAPPWEYRGPFASAKVGLVSLTKTLAKEESEAGITVNMICPGDITGQYKEMNIDQVRHVQHDVVAPVGRTGTGEDIARVVRFLCQDHSDFITGSIIDVNGGLNVLTKN